MRISRAGLELIKAFEGFREGAARLPDGRWIIGYGHVRTAREGVTITEKDAEDLLKNDLRVVEDAVRSLVFAPLNQAQFDALVSLAFNISPGQFKDSEILRRLNEGDLIGAAGAFDAWRRARVNGRMMVVDALVRRRAAEKALFLAATVGQATAPTPIVIPEWDPSAGGGGRSSETANAPDVLLAIERLTQERDRAERAVERATAAPVVAEAAAEPVQVTTAAPVTAPEAPAVEDRVAEAEATPASTTPEEASRTVAARIARILERADTAAATAPAAVKPAADEAPREIAAQTIIDELPDFATDAARTRVGGEAHETNGRKLIDDTERFDPGRDPQELFTDGLHAEREVNGRVRKLGVMDNRALRIAPFVAFLILSIIGLAIGLVEVFKDDTRSISGASTVVAVFGLLTVMGIYFVAANSSDSER